MIYALADEKAVAVLRLTLESVTRQLRELSTLASSVTPDTASADEGNGPVE